MDYSNKFFYAPPPFYVSIKSLLRFLLVGFTIILLFASCSKDDIKTQVVANHDAKYDTYYKLLSFIERIDDKPLSRPFITPRTGYTASEVVEFVEGGLNLEYADAVLTWASYEHTTDTFTISLVSGYASQGTVDALFERARDSASVFFYDISEPDKFPSLYDVVTLYSSGSSLQISVMTLVGKVHKDLSPFGEYDFWDIFPNEATCDPYDEGPNASAVMTDAINDYFTPYGCVFFTNQTFISSLDDELDPPLVGWEADNPSDIAGDWVVDFRTFKTVCNHTTNQCLDFVDNGIYCLAPEEMNYYFVSILGIYFDYTIETDLDHILTYIGLYQRSIEDDDIKTWECGNYFGTLNYCDEGDFPYMLPICC